MVTADTGLPPISKISLIGIWIETVLYGTNCVVYGLCMFILLRRDKAATLRRVLVVVSTIIFILCTVYVGASLQQLLEAFVYAPVDVPNYSTMYWLDYSTPLRILKDILYASQVVGIICMQCSEVILKGIMKILAKDFILIWRLYVVFLHDWRVVVFPIIFATCSVGSAYAASAVSASSKDALYGFTARSLLTLAWVFEFTLNTIVTATITTRLWWMGRTTASLTATSTRTNRFAPSIYIIIESGAIALVSSTVLFALFISSSPLLSVASDIIAQVAILVPLLIIIQAVKFGRHHVPNVNSSTTICVAQSEIRFLEGGFQEENVQEDELFDVPLSRSPSSSRDAPV